MVTLGTEKVRPGEAPSRTPDVNAFRKSEEVIVPEKQTNKSNRSSAESVEGRTSTKRNILHAATVRTQSRGVVSFGVEGVRHAAMRSKDMVFTNLLHHMTYDLLYASLMQLKKNAAVGIDGMTWIEYQRGVEKRLSDLHDRVHRGSYHALPTKRAFIVKSDGEKRLLGIAALENKIVQRASKVILNQIYEVDFKGISYGFSKVGNSFGISLTPTRQHAELVMSDEFVGFYFGEQKTPFGWAFRYMPVGRDINFDITVTPEQRLYMYRRSKYILGEVPRCFKWVGRIEAVPQ